MIVDRARYVDGVRLAQELACRDDARPGFVWVGLYQPTPDEFADVADEFDLHPLAVEDAEHAHQRPKLERYDDSWFLVVKTVAYVGRRSDRRRRGDVVRRRLLRRQRPSRPRRQHGRDPAASSEPSRSVSPTVRGRCCTRSSTAWSTSTRSVVRRVEDDIADIQADVFDQPRAAHAGRIFLLKREILEFRQAVSPVRGAAPASRRVRTHLPVTSCTTTSGTSTTICAG